MSEVYQLLREREREIDGLLLKYEIGKRYASLGLCLEDLREGLKCLRDEVNGTELRVGVGSSYEMSKDFLYDVRVQLLGKLLEGVETKNFQILHLRARYEYVRKSPADLGWVYDPRELSRKSFRGTYTLDLRYRGRVDLERLKGRLHLIEHEPDIQPFIARRFGREEAEETVLFITIRDIDEMKSKLVDELLGLDGELVEAVNW
jgi:hypothetical protein